MLRLECMRAEALLLAPPGLRTCSTPATLQCTKITRVSALSCSMAGMESRLAGSSAGCPSRTGEVGGGHSSWAMSGPKMAAAVPSAWTAVSCSRPSETPGLVSVS